MYISWYQLFLSTLEKKKFPTFFGLWCLVQNPFQLGSATHVTNHLWRRLYLCLRTQEEEWVDVWKLTKSNTLLVGWKKKKKKSAFSPSLYLYRLTAAADNITTAPFFFRAWLLLTREREKREGGFEFHFLIFFLFFPVGVVFRQSHYIYCGRLYSSTNEASSIEKTRALSVSLSSYSTKEK